MKLAVMQPYFLPYIGYFQLIDSVDLFVVYDDVNYIKKGWINRNNIQVNGQPHLFSIPLQSASQNKCINEIEVENGLGWKTSLLKTINLAYKKAPFFDAVFPLLEEIINANEHNLAKYCSNSLQKACNYLQIETKFTVSSEIDKDNTLKGQDKILEICKKYQPEAYINAIGGMELYDKPAFEKANINLQFLKTNAVTYRQFNAEFLPWLSIIDVMMFNSIAEIRALLNQKEFI
jgi:hypothetical protein